MLGLPKDPEGQKKFLIGAAPVILLVLYYLLLHPKRVEEIEALTSEHATLQSKNDAAKQESSPTAVRALQQKLALFDQHIKRLEELIPSEEQVAGLLFDVSQRAGDAGVDLGLLQPSAEEQLEFYQQRTYDARVIGNYHQIGRFFAYAGSLPRIVTVSDVRIMVLPGNPAARQSRSRLQADFKIHTYVIPPPPAPDSARPMPAGSTTTTTTG